MRAPGMTAPQDDPQSLSVTAWRDGASWVAQVTARKDGATWTPDSGPEVRAANPTTATRRAIAAYEGKTAPTIACERCRYAWTPRVADPKKCPRCENARRYVRRVA